MFDTVKIGRKIAELRKAHNMTQFELADAHGNSFQAVSNWERGASMPDISKLGELSEMSGRTKEHLCRSFRKYFGVAPIEYINANRLNYAANLLLHSDMKVVDIAFASGFQSLSRFYHAFREEFDVSPLDYRQSCTDSGI